MLDIERDELTKWIGERLREAREHKRLQAGIAAAIVGVSRETVLRIERATSRPDLLTLTVIALAAIYNDREFLSELQRRVLVKVSDSNGRALDNRN